MQQDEDGGDGGDGDRDKDLKEFSRMESKTFRAFPHPVRQLFHPLSLLASPTYTPSFILLSQTLLVSLSTSPL